MECVNSTNTAKEMTCGHRVKLVLGEFIFTSNKAEIAFMYFNHHRIFEVTDRTVTCRKLSEITSYLKLNSATMTPA